MKTGRVYRTCALAFAGAVILTMARPVLCPAEELATADQALRKIFPQAQSFIRREILLTPEQTGRIAAGAQMTFDEAHSLKITVYLAQNSGRTSGYGFEDTVHGKWGPIHYLVGVDLAGAVIDTVILDYQEIRGKPVAKRRFLKQYRGKSARDPLQLKEDINGISGATISSRSLTEGIRKLLFILAEIQTGLITAPEPEKP